MNYNNDQRHIWCHSLICSLPSSTYKFKKHFFPLINGKERNWVEGFLQNHTLIQREKEEVGLSQVTIFLLKMAKVTLHVYDLTNGSEKTNSTIVHINKIFKNGIGLGGIFHSAVQVYSFFLYVLFRCRNSNVLVFLLFENCNCESWVSILMLYY